MLEIMYAELHIPSDSRKTNDNYAMQLKQKDEATYRHSVRVALLAADIAEYLNIDPYACGFIGAMHDIGKVFLDDALLKKTQGFNEEDMKQMRKHPEYSYQILKDANEFCAEVALRHHRYQNDKYPLELHTQEVAPEPIIDRFAMVIALADYYDAAKHRVNDKHGEKRPLTEWEVRFHTLSDHPEQAKLIKELYLAGIFGEAEHPPLLPRHSVHYRLAA